jgi:Protein of unknown function (DUF3006)
LCVCNWTDLRRAARRVLLLYPHGRESFDMPRELLPEDARAGEDFEVSFTCDRRETERMGAENERLLDELLERDG